MLPMSRLFWVPLNMLQALWLVVWTGILFLPAVFFGLVQPSKKIALAMARVLWAPALLAAGPARLRVEGLENVDFSKPHIFVSNHQSMLDIAVMFQALPVNLRYILKAELKKVPLIGWYSWAMGMVFVDRRDTVRAKASLARAGELIRGGASIIAFPEGTRSRDGGQILPFKKGVFVTALHAGVPVVPVSVEGAQKVLPSDGFRVRPGEVRVKVGKPIPTQGMTLEDREALLRQVRDAVIDLNLEIGGHGGDKTDAIASGRSGPALIREQARAA
jgi:1-acyl-sn-glycerol-3-phosphate acyltransferase